MKNMTLNQRISLALVGGLIVGGALAWFILGPGDTRVTLTEVPADAAIYIDNDLTAEGESGTVMLSDIGSGTHTILVAASGYWPWAKTIVLENGAQLNFAVLALPVEATVADAAGLPTTDASAATELRAKMTTVASKESPLLYDDEDVALWIEDGTIVASWRARRSDMPAYFCTPECRPRRVVFESDVPVRSLSFFGDRNDILLFAANNGIFALELDGRGTQNFQPLYLGTAPIFSLSEDLTHVTVYDTDPKRSGFFSLEL